MNILKKGIAIGIIAGIISLQLTVSSKAVANGERITSYVSNIVITRDNKAKVTETIIYDFGANERHGIYRDIPIEYKEKNDTYYLNLDYKETVDAQGDSVNSETSSEGRNMRIKLGDADKFVSGKKTYKISYEIYPIITNKNNKPFLNIDTVGTGWNVPIDYAKSTVTLEDASKRLIQPECFYGVQGSLMKCETEVVGTGSYIAKNLSPYQGMTVNASLPQGYVTHYLEPNKLRTSDVIMGAAVIAAIAIAVLASIWAIVVLIMKKWRVYSLRKRQIVVAQYDPPKSMSPAEIGHLEDDSSSMAEVTATLIDMAVRGYIKITQTEKTGITSIFGGKEYRFRKAQPLEALPLLTKSEKVLYDAIFSNGEDVALQDIEEDVISEAIIEFQSLTKTTLESKGFYNTKGGITTKGDLSESGAKEWALVEGFKLYLNVVEKDRLAFTDAPAKTPQRFSAILPYAIALGVEKQWTKQFEGMDLASQTSWYSGSNMALFSTTAFVSDLNSGFSSAVSSNSSVSSGGGSSGGGFSGGGGSSW